MECVVDVTDDWLDFATKYTKHIFLSVGRQTQYEASSIKLKLYKKKYSTFSKHNVKIL